MPLRHPILDRDVEHVLHQVVHHLIRDFYGALHFHTPILKLTIQCGWHGVLVGFGELERAGGQGKNREVVAVADLDHVTIRVVEEELIDLDAAFLDDRGHVLHVHRLELLHHELHVGALERDVVVLGIDRPFLRRDIVHFKQMDANSIVEQPEEEDKANFLIKPTILVVNGSAKS